jgi:hypothetical protein
MKMRTVYPRVSQVQPLTGKRLLVRFDNGVTKVYDCTPLLKDEPFVLLSNDAVFRSVHADPHGYGVVWTDDLDLAESELWANGEVAEESSPAER